MAADRYSPLSKYRLPLSRYFCFTRLGSREQLPSSVARLATSRSKAHGVSARPRVFAEKSISFTFHITSFYLMGSDTRRNRRRTCPATRDPKSSEPVKNSHFDS